MSITLPVTELTEAELTDLVAGHGVLAAALGRELRLPPFARTYIRVPLPDVASRPGDVDLLAFAPSRPDVALAIECKRVKVSSAAFTTTAPTKLRAASRGVKQASALWQLGFHRVALLVIVAVDGRERVEYNFAHRGLSTSLLRAIYGAFDEMAMPQELGLVMIELVQPEPKPVHEAASFGIQWLADGVTQQQPQHLTEWLGRLSQLPRGA